MKKLLFISLLAVPAFAGCRDNEEPTAPADADYTGLVLNEVCGDDGSAGNEDWVELYNTTDATIDLNGVQIVKTDEDGVSEVLCTFAEGSVIGGKAYAVKMKNADFTQGISNTKNVAIMVLSPSGAQIDKFDKQAAFGDDGSHPKGGSYSRIPDGTGTWTVVNEATKGTANKVTDKTDDGDDEGQPVTPPVPGVDYTVVKLNELNGNDKFIELYNTSDKEIDISGMSIRKDAEKINYVAPQGKKIAARGFLLLPTTDDAEDFSIGFTGGLSADKSVQIELLSPAGEPVDVFRNLSESKGMSWGEKDGKYDGKSPKKRSFGRDVDGTGHWYVMDATQGASNAGATIDTAQGEIMW